MTSQLLIAIAALCGSNNSNAWQKDILACEKYYISCVREAPILTKEAGLAECVMKRELK